MKAIAGAIAVSILLSIILAVVNNTKYIIPEAHEENDKISDVHIKQGLSAKEENNDLHNEEKIELSGTLVQSHNIEGIPLISQLPELPTGCEVTSLTMVLNYLGSNADKLEIVREYLPKEDLVKDEQDVLYGPDFRYIFPGDPENDTSFGCFAPCITETADKYLKEKNAVYSANDISGTSFYDLFDYIAEDIPVIIWSTMNLLDTQYEISWRTNAGEIMSWPKNEHCVVLSGYSYSNNTVQIYDPTNGILTLNMEDVKERYDQLGKNAVLISSVK